MTHNDIFYELTKHIEINCQLVRHHVHSDSVSYLIFPSKFQIVDLLIKVVFVFLLNRKNKNKKLVFSIQLKVTC